MEFPILCYSRQSVRWKQPKAVRQLKNIVSSPKQLIRSMKLTTVILLATCFNVAAAGHAQKVTIALENVPIQKIFREIGLQGNVTIIYDAAYFKEAKPVSIKVKDALPTEVIKLCLSGLPFTFTEEKSSIVITPTPGLNQASVSLFSLQLFPPIKISGVIIDDKNGPIAGATVAIKGTNKGTSAGSDGNFTLHEIPEDAILEVSAVGFIPINIKIIDKSVVRVTANGKKIEQLTMGNADHIIIRLERSSSPLDETVIIAYGSTTKRFNTGNVSTVKAEEIEKQPVMNLQQALQGRVPGLEITTMSGNSMAPVKMEIRGRNSINPSVLSEPLYVIDGVPYTVLNVSKLAYSNDPPETSLGMSQTGLSNTKGQNVLAFINPKDIESIDVLKDADATAIYGSRGSNGVILITTKRGKAGPTRFNLSINQGTLLIPKKLDLMSTPEYLAARREALANDGTIITEQTAMDVAKWDPNRFTDWQKVLYGTGSQTLVSAGVSGGLNQTTYSINASYDTRKELMNNSGRNANSSLLMSIDHRSADQKFNVGFKTMLGVIDAHAFSIGGGATLPPNAPDIYTKDKELNFEEWSVGFTNFYPFDGLLRGSTETGHSVNASMNIGYQIIKGLTLSANAGYSFGSTDGTRLTPLASVPPAYRNPFAANSFSGTTVNKVWSAEPQISYNTYIGRGSLTAMVGGALQVNSTAASTIIGMGYENDNQMSSVSNALMTIGVEGFAEYKYVAGFGRLNYNWDNKYIISLNARRDGSSRFGPGKQFGNFASIGLAWLASEETWMKEILPAWLSFAKLRGSYGNSGGDGVGNYEYLSRWGVSPDPSSGNKWPTYGDVPSILTMFPINPLFQWESTRKLEGALELGLFKDMVNIVAAYYRNRSDDQLVKYPTPSYTGFDDVTANLGALVQNSGFEFSANARIVKTKNLSVAARLIFSLNRNKLINFPGLERSPYADDYQIGKSLTTNYYLRYIGVDPANGEQIFEDRNKDGVVSTPDKFIPGDPDNDMYVPIDLTPKYSGGFGFQVAYKQFDVDMYFVYKNQIGTNPLTTLSVGSMNNLILPDEVKNNHWKKVGDHVPYPKYSAGSFSRIRSSDGAFTDASFVKLGNITISYELPQRWISKLKMNSCRLSVSSRDLFYITSYNGLNPEVQSLSGVSPLPRLISTSLIVNF